MKSRILSFNGLLETWKRQFWVFALVCLAYFLAYPVAGLMEIEQWMSYDELQKIPGAYKRLFFQYLCGTPQGHGGLTKLLILAVLLGVLCGVSGLSYLHIRRQVDFYHSLPARREGLFLIQVLTGSVIYLIPASVGMLLLMGVGVSQGIFTLPALGAGLASVLLGLVFFLMGYSVAALAMLLTGRILVGILGTAVFLGYVPLVKLMKELLCGMFFSTYYAGSRSGVFYEAWNYGTPFGWAVKTASELNGGRGWLIALGAALVTLALFALDMWLYRKRPSEAAGNSMTFRGAAVLIKVVLTVTGALAMSLFFISLADSGRKSDFWFVFGLVFGLLLVYGLIQMIYTLNIRRIFSEKWPLFVSAVLTVLAAAIFRFDILGYDSYLPGQEELADINVMTEGEFRDVIGYSGGISENLDDMKMGCDDSLYQLAGELVAGDAKVSAESELQDVRYEEQITFFVKYILKNGREAYRSYTVYTSDIRKAGLKRYDNQDYLDHVMPIRTIEPEKVGEIVLYSLNWIPIREQTLYAEKDTKRLELVRAYQEDARRMSSAVIAHEHPVGWLKYNYNAKDSSADPLTHELEQVDQSMLTFAATVFIYPSYTRTLAVLRKLGYDLSGTLDARDVREIRIRHYESGDAQPAADPGMLMEDGSVTDGMEEEDTVVYKDREEMEAILNDALYYRFSSVWDEFAENIEVEIVMKDGNELRDGEFLLLKDKLPEFLK